MINTTPERLKARNFFIVNSAFMSSWNFVPCWVEHEKQLYNLEAWNKELRWAIQGNLGLLVLTYMTHFFVFPECLSSLKHNSKMHAFTIIRSNDQSTDSVFLKFSNLLLAYEILLQIMLQETTVATQFTLWIGPNQRLTILLKMC